MNREAPIRIAFVGAGHWMESHHLPVLLRLKDRWPIEFIGIWNRTKEKAVRLAERFGIPKVYDQLRDLVQDPEPNCRVIVVGREVVYSILQELNQNPLPFLCEKPPGQAAAEAKALATVIQVPHMLAFNRRYAPLYDYLRTFLQKQKRPPYWVECSFYRRARKDPHMVVESGIHGINFLEYLMGLMEKVTPLPVLNIDLNQTQETSGEKVEPRVALIEFQSGTKGLLKFFPYTGKALEKYEFQSKDCSVYLYMKQPFLDEEKETLLIFQHTEEGLYIQPVDVPALPQDPLLQQGFVGEYEEFLQIVRNPSWPSRSNFQNGWTSLAIAEAIEQGKTYYKDQEPNSP